MPPPLTCQSSMDMTQLSICAVPYFSNGMRLHGLRVSFAAVCHHPDHLCMRLSSHMAQSTIEDHAHMCGAWPDADRQMSTGPSTSIEVLHSHACVQGRPRHSTSRCKEATLSRIHHNPFLFARDSPRCLPQPLTGTVFGQKQQLPSTWADSAVGPRLPELVVTAAGG
jgi:hypothetical protein